MKLRPRDQMIVDLELYRQRMYEIALKRGMDPIKANTWAVEQASAQSKLRSEELAALQKKRQARHNR